jgi:hypothetical protein
MMIVDIRFWILLWRYFTLLPTWLQNRSLLVYLSIFINMIINGCCNKSSKKLYIGEQTIQWSKDTNPTKLGGELRCSASGTRLVLDSPLISSNSFCSWRIFFVDTDKYKIASTMQISWQNRKVVYITSF